MDSLSAYKKEIDSKKAYTPDGKESEYLNSLKSLWKSDLDSHNKPYDFFQRKNLLAYMLQNEQDSYALFNQVRTDRWRNNTRLTTQRDKVDAIISAIADLNLEEEFHSFKIHGERVKAVETPMEHLMEHANIKDEYERKQKFASLYLLTHGTISEDIGWFDPEKKGRLVTKMDKEAGTFSFKEGKELENTGKIWTRIQPLNRLVLGDITQPFIELQPHIWKEFVLDYTIAKQMWGEWKNFKEFVRPVTQITREWTTLKSESQTEDQTTPRKVHCLVFENIWADESAVICNGVLVTPVGLPMPGKFLDKQYSVTLSQLYDFSPNFAYGYSFVQRLHNDSVLKDFFYNAIVDRTRQELEPPLVTSYRTILNRHMFAPSKVTQVGAQFQVEKLIRDEGGINNAMAVTEFIDANLDKVIPPIFGGAATQGGTTAYEIREQMRNALRTMYNVFSSVAYARKKRAELVCRLILEKYPDLGVSPIDNEVSKALGGVKHIFTVKGRAADLGGEGLAQVAFAKMPEGTDRIKAYEAMSKDEETGKKNGDLKKWFVLDPKTISEMNHIIYVKINPSQRKSKMADRQEAREDYALYMQNPIIDPEVTTRELLVSDGKDPDKYIKKQEPQLNANPEEPQAGQEPPMKAPKMPSSPQQGAEKNMNQLEKATL